MIRNPRIVRPSIRTSIVLTVVVLMVGLSSRPARAQGGGGGQVFELDLGVFGLNTLATIAPSLLFRPFDTFGVRPDAVALGMGGAYTARSTNAFATSWSPAGLTGVTEFSLAADAVAQSSSGSVTGFPTVLEIPASPLLTVTGYDNKLKSRFQYGSLSMAVPLWTGKNQKVVGALSWRRQANPTSGEQAVQDLTLEENGSTPVTLAVDRSEKGAVETYGPSLGVQLLPGVSLGASANFLIGRMRINGATRVNTGGGGSPPPGTQRFTQKYSGFNFDLGARFEALSNRVAVAAKFTPEYTLEVTGGGYNLTNIQAPGAPSTNIFGKLAGYDLTVPSAFNAGIALQPTQRLWLTADIESQKMGDTTLEYNGVTPLDTPEPEHAYQDVSNLRFGAEYMLFRKSWANIPIRVGYRQVDLGYRQPAGEDYTYIYSFQLPGLTQEQRDGIDDFQTVAVVYDGSPSGEAVDGNAYSFGFSLATDRVTYDVGFDVLSYEEQKFNLDSSWDTIFNPNPVEGDRRPRDSEGVPLPVVNVHPSLISIDRSLTNIRFSATYRFPGLF